MNSFTTSSTTTCSITYSMTNTDGTTMDSSFAFYTSSKYLSIYTTTQAKDGTYNLRLTGVLGTTTTPSTYADFVVTISKCKVATFGINTFPLTYYTYDITTTALTATFTAWTCSVSACGTFTYTMLQTSGSALPTCITFDATTRTMTVSASTNTCNGVYQVTVTGQLGTHTQITKTISTYVRVQELCVLGTTSLTTQLYTVNASPYFITFTDFGKTNCSTNTTSIVYTGTQTSASSGSLPTYIALTSSTRTL